MEISWGKLLFIILLMPISIFAQTLQVVTDNGNVTTKSISAASFSSNLVYNNQIKPLFESANYRSGWIIESSGSINFGLVGSKESGFVYRWLAHNAAPINYGVNSDELMRLSFEGNLGIGTINPTEKLSVNGKIRAHEIKVETANWPDYVFAKDYQLPSLKETEKHILEKGHLEGIPSAEEVKSNGINVGEMNAKLLQKIEELTLIMIQLNKKVEQQSLTIERQEGKLQQFQDQMKSLNNKKDAN